MAGTEQNPGLVTAHGSFQAFCPCPWRVGGAAHRGNAIAEAQRSSVSSWLSRSARVMSRLLHPIQEYVNIVLQRLLACISVNPALFQSGQRSAPLPSWNVS